MSNVIYDTVIWISDENSSGNIQRFQLLQSSAYTELWTFLLLVLPCQWESWGYTRSWEGTQLGLLTQTQRHSISYGVSNKSWGEEGGGMFRVMKFVFPTNCCMCHT